MSVLTDLLDRSRVPYQLPPHRHVRSGWVGVDCPRCSGGGGKYKLGFELATGRAICWSCGRFDSIAVLAELCGISTRDAAGVWSRIPRYQPTIQHTGRLVIPPGVGPLGAAHIQYLRRRGFEDPEGLARLWELKGIGIASKLRWRIFIPIFTVDGRQVSWTTRAIGNVPDRYVSASSEEEAVPHKSILYGAHLAQHVAVVVEGPVDAWAIGPGAVATCGTSYSTEQVAAAAQYPVRVLCYDDEPAAQRRAQQFARQLAAFPGTTHCVTLETGSDAAAARPEERAELRAAFGLDPVPVYCSPVQ